MIHVCFGLHDKDGRYSKFTGTAILSIFENTDSKITVHILHDNTLSADNRDKFLIMAKNYGQLIKFYNVNELCASKITKIIEMIPAIKTARVSIGALFRLLIPDIIPCEISKLIYLDSDVIVNLDIVELWRFELGDKPMAAVPEYEADYPLFKNKNVAEIYPIYSGLIAVEKYFNSGVILFNLNRLRNEKETLIEGIKFRAEHTKTKCFDQDILNYCFTKEYLKLPNRFNQFVWASRNNIEEVQNIIHHYAGDGVNLNMNDPFNRLWFKYFSMTPWFNENVIAHLDEGYGQIINQKDADLKDFKDFTLQMTALVSGKTRAFFVNVSNIELMKQIFYVRADEEIIQFVNEESFQILADSMYNSRGKKIFFILFDDYPQLSAALSRAGFVEGRDFINAAMFLSDANDVPLNTYQLVKSL